MVRVAFVVWSLLGVVFAMASIIVIVVVPALAAHDSALIPWGVGLGFVLAVPAAWVVARRMAGADFIRMD